MELSKKEQEQLAKLQWLITEIVELKAFENSHILHLKIYMTPDVEKLTLFRDELKAIQEKIINYKNYEFIDLITESVNDFRKYYKHYVQDSKTIDDDFGLRDYPDEWQEIFISNFIDFYADYGAEVYLNFDFDSIDFDDFDEIEFKWFDNPAKYIPLKNIDILVDCISTISYFQEIFDFYHLALENKEIIIELPNRKQKQKQQQNSYQWLIKPDKELPELYNRMIKGKIISQIDFPAFRSIFTGQPVESIATKIQWLADGVLLAYFIDSIRNKLPMATDVWSVAKQCFENASSLKQSQYNYSTVGTGKPKQHKLIDDLLKDL
jgi:hypothetical protein